MQRRHYLFVWYELGSYLYRKGITYLSGISLAHICTEKALSICLVLAWLIFVKRKHYLFVWYKLGSYLYREGITYLSGISLAHICTEKALPICLV